ncbi:MAG: helix-turn-helix domain-containing protein, partial [Victivallales bacterium]|nr:helix-turn-helix domain-containing protein [Victivallales bacterium]
MVKSISNALKVLDYLVARHIDGENASLAEISDHLGLRNTTVRNMLKTMEESGYLARGMRRSYTLGPRCLDIERVRFGGAKLADAAIHPLTSLAERIGESVVLATMTASERKVLIRVDGGNVVSVDSTKVDAGGGGACSLVTNRVLLAYASSEELYLFVERYGLPRADEWSAAVSIEDLFVELRGIRGKGFAELRGEQLSSISFPVFAGANLAVAAVGVYAPSYRYDDEKSEIGKKAI